MVSLVFVSLLSCFVSLKRIRIWFWCFYYIFDQVHVGWPICTICTTDLGEVRFIFSFFTLFPKVFHALLPFNIFLFNLSTIWLTYHCTIRSFKLIKRTKISKIEIQIPVILGIPSAQNWEVETGKFHVMAIFT